MDCSAISHRAKAEAEVILASLESKKKECVAEEVRMDKSSKEFDELLSTKKKLMNQIMEYRGIFDRNNVPLENISIANLNKLIGTLNVEIRTLDEEILNEDDEPGKLEEIMNSLVRYREKLIIMESQLRQESINNFMSKATEQRVTASKRDNNRIFNIARADAEDRAASIFILDDDEIASMFSSNGDIITSGMGVASPRKNYVSWPHIIRNRFEGIVPLAPGVEIPKRFNPVTKKMEDYVFSLTSFFRNSKFIKKLNEYYHPMGLDLTITQDKKYKNKWWIRIQTVSGTITFKQMNNY